MSADKTIIASTSCPPKKKRQYSVEELFKMKLRRRELYRELSFDKSESLLSQRRSKEFESKSQRVLLDSSKEGLSFKAEVELPKKTTLMICEPSSVTERVDISSAVGASTWPTAGSGKGKNLTDHFFVFELGLTSVHPMNDMIQRHCLSQTKVRFN
nr:uncharacterized protein LOC104086180 [Nicotiana tomentosiformis]XP_033509291.1 uncharacterized protein LOC104086180 [Nicotiana tomentosiformis]